MFWPTGDRHNSGFYSPPRPLLLLHVEISLGAFFSRSMGRSVPSASQLNPMPTVPASSDALLFWNQGSEGYRDCEEISTGKEKELRDSSSRKTRSKYIHVTPPFGCCSRNGSLERGSRPFESKSPHRHYNLSMFPHKETRLSSTSSQSFPT